MIDPYNITKFDRTEPELQEFWLFCIFVSGKNADVQSRKLEEFLNGLTGQTPFEKVKNALQNGILMDELKRVGAGQYGRIHKALEDSVQLDLSCYHSPSVLEQVRGVGPKTARFFVVHSWPNQPFAVIDTHLTKWLKSLGYDTNKKYNELEMYFINEAYQRGENIADLDLRIWRYYKSQ